MLETIFKKPTEQGEVKQPTPSVLRSDKAPLPLPLAIQGRGPPVSDKGNRDPGHKRSERTHTPSVESGMPDLPLPRGYDALENKIRDELGVPGEKKDAHPEFPTAKTTNKLAALPTSFQGRKEASENEMKNILAERKERELHGDDPSRGIERTTPSMRPKAFLAGAEAVIPDGKSQLQSDVMFDMFSSVSPGFGQGRDNKLYVENEANQEFIRFRDPLYRPRQHSGHVNGIQPLPWQWQDVMPRHLVEGYFKQFNKRIDDLTAMISNVPERVVNTLPTDVVTVPSSKGCYRKPSPLEPIINNIQPWLAVQDPAGVFLNKRGFKHTTSSWRDPKRLELDLPNTGPTLSQRRALNYPSYGQYLP